MVTTATTECSLGHANPVSNQFCQTCGIRLEPQQEETKRRLPPHRREDDEDAEYWDRFQGFLAESRRAALTYLRAYSSAANRLRDIEARWRQAGKLDESAPSIDDLLAEELPPGPPQAVQTKPGDGNGATAMVVVLVVILLAGLLLWRVTSSSSDEDTGTNSEGTATAIWDTSLVVQQREPSGLRRIFFASPSTNEQLLDLAKQCVEQNGDARGVACYGYFSAEDVAFDAIDEDGHVAHTCFRVRYQRTPDGGISSDPDTSSHRSGDCPTDVAERAATATDSQGLARGADGPGGLPMPAGATFHETIGYGDVYHLPAGVSTDDVVAFYRTYAPLGQDLGEWEWCEVGPLLGYYVDGRIWTIETGARDVPVLELAIGEDEGRPRINVILREDGMPCGH